jgi:hypothetical protein
MPDPAAPPVIRLRIPCKDEREFRDRFAPKYAARGVFVPTNRPRVIGTRLHLKIELKDGLIGVSGDAMVTGQTDSGPGGRPGMTLRLTSLHAGSIQFELSPVGRTGPPVPARRTDPADGPPPLRDSLDPGNTAKPLAVRKREVKFKLRETPKGLSPAATPTPVAPGDALEHTPAPLSVKVPWRDRSGTRSLVIVAIVVSVAVVGALAAAASLAARAASDREARVVEDLRVADARILEGRLAGFGGDSALDHLLAARALAAVDARVTSRLRLIAEKFEQLGTMAEARGDLREAAVHYQTAVRAEPGREGARQKLRNIVERGSVPGAQGK